MFDKQRLMFIYAVSPVHLGAGQAIGVVDNPIQRERHTGHPMAASSGIKGALRHHLYHRWDRALLERIFGPETNASDYAGCVSFGDGQTVAFPVRSLKRSFIYATSLVSLARLLRMAMLAGLDPGWNLPELLPDQALVAHEGVLVNDRLVLEAFDFPAVVCPQLSSIALWLSENALPNGNAHQHFREKIRVDLALLPEESFSHFVRNATVIEPHVKINNATGTATGEMLFYTENLPPESLLTVPVLTSMERAISRSRRDTTTKQMDSATVMQTVVSGNDISPGLDGTLVQLGGDATIGRGQVVLRFAPQSQEASM